MARWKDIVRCSTGMSSGGRELKERLFLLSGKKRTFKLLSVLVVLFVLVLGICAFGSAGNDTADSSEDLFAGGDMQVWEISDTDFKDDYRSQWIVYICNKVPNMDMDLDGRKENIYITRREVPVSGENGQENQTWYEYHMGAVRYMQSCGENSKFELLKMAAFPLEKDITCLAIIYNNAKDGDAESMVFLFRKSWNHSVLLPGDITEQYQEEYYPLLCEALPEVLVDEGDSWEISRGGMISFDGEIVEVLPDYYVVKVLRKFGQEEYSSFDEEEQIYVNRKSFAAREKEYGAGDEIRVVYNDREAKEGEHITLDIVFAIYPMPLENR